MYSGTTIRTKSGRIMGTHQKIDRVAYRQLRRLLAPEIFFPSIKDILHFEGKNGPDGIKSKSPGRDEPWHFIDPEQLDNAPVLDTIDSHRANLTTALVRHDNMRAAFEAAWLAHAIVDVLTPAHQYPLGEKIEELWGKPHEERDSVKDKRRIRGDTMVDSLVKNWQYFGAGGVMTTHYMFEWGVAATISPLRFYKILPDANQLIMLNNNGFRPQLLSTIRTIYAMNLYEEYYKRGWTRRLARETKQVLAPLIINAVIMSWYDAAMRVEAKR